MFRMKVIMAISLFLGLAACATTTEPTMTPLEIQSMQTRTYDTNKGVAFPSVISVFQDIGYSVQSADMETGLITAESAANSDAAFAFWTGVTRVQQTRATAFVEEIRGVANVRLNFVEVDQRSGGWGQANRQDTPILDATAYQNAFERIENAIFIRSEN